MLLRYAATTSLVATAALLRAAFGESLQDYPLLLFFPAVFLCALLFGKGSGFFATLLSAGVAAHFFVEPKFSFRVGWEQTPAFAIFLIIGFAMAAVIEALRHAAQRLEAAEQSKSLLLEELAHRTKNDLAIIGSALTLQARASGSEAVKAALEAAIARVHVVAAAHDRLKGDQHAGQVDIPTYLQELCTGLGDLLRDVRPIAVRLRAAPMSLASSHAVTVGLIVNELVTNALKYAFPDDRGGVVEVEVEKVAGSVLQIGVRDDGVGCPSNVQSGLGSRLVRLLARQHGGAVRREAGEPGCRVVVILSFDVS